MTRTEGRPPAATPSGGAARRVAGYASGVLGLLLLALSAAWWSGEAHWGQYRDLAPEEAFTDGSFGLEMAPLKYMLVADTISAQALRLPGGPSWVARFGFLPRNASGPCAKDAPSNLPVGFSVSNRLPGSGTPVPVQFVGLTCALCHSATINGRTIIGAGSQTADVIGFTDAFLNAVLDPGLDADKILDVYARQCPADAAGIPRRQVEAFFINSWLSALRSQARDNATKYDLPFHGAAIGVPGNIPTGPSRTRPFRSVVRNTLDFPGADNRAYSKVPLAAMQIDKQWSQFDGSIGDPIVRSMIAVFTSGASIAALDEPQIADNVRKAATYTLRLGVDPKLPHLRDVFTNLPPPSPEALAQGRAVYMTHCDGCHGHPEDSGWVMPKTPNPPSITPLAEIGTDPARLEFRYTEMLPSALAATLPLPDIGPQRKLLQAQFDAAMKDGDLVQADWWRQDIDQLEQHARIYPTGHRLAFPANEIALRHGYLNAPIPFAWLRAPYLHNASVPTLSALIGLTPRPDRFCRGDIGYDPVAMGVKFAVPPGDACPKEAPFLFDTSQPGNSNAGHDYPQASVGAAERQALLAYLGTL